MKKTLLWMLIVLIVVGLLTGCSLESEDCNHDWSEWSEATAPTCKENGTEARSCTKCGEPETRTVLSLGHSFNTQNICTECGEELVFTKGLEYGEITVGDKMLYAVIGIGAAKETDIVIPVAHAGNSVLAVAPSAFKGNDLITSVYIPDGIEYIGANAFEYCVSLKSVNIGKTTSYIGTKAFDNCSGLESIYVSGDQLKIDKNAFSNGNKLTTITLTGDIREIAQHAFNNTAYYDNPINWVSGALYIGEYLIDTNVELIPPSFIVKEGTKLIATSAFSNNDALVSITLPQGLKYINSRAFYGCASLAAISAPETLIAIDYGAFTDCLSLAEFYSTKYIELGNDVFLRSGLKRVTINVGWYLHSSYSSILDNLPKSSIEELNIYGVIRTNDNYSFTPFSRLKLLAFYDSISLATGTLSGLSNLEKMTIPTISLSEHFGYLFGAKEYENSTLVYGYYIPNSLKDITLLVERDRNLKVDETDMYLVSKGPLFKGWTLDRLTLQVDPDDKTEYAVNTTILGYAKIGTLTYGSQINYWSNFNESKAAYPSNVDTINYLGTFEEWCGEDAQQVVSVTKNSSKLFIKGVRIKELIIPDGVTDIEKYYSHISVEKLVIPGSVKTIGRHSYIRATDLKTLIIEDGVKTVGEGAFLGCTSLVNLTLGNITTIDQYAFSGCESLKNVTVPGTIESIGFAAFNDGGLTNIAFESGVTHISFQAFSNCTSLQNVSLPNTLLEIGTYAFKGCTGLNSIALPDSIENVGGLRSLVQELHLPNMKTPIMSVMKITHI